MMERATQPDVISAIVGLDPRNWYIPRTGAGPSCA
jgi:hypothetical protein